MNCSISVVVLTYNSSFNDIKQTIISILKQKDITFEIIVADDGSKENHFEQIKSLFDDFSFINYQFIGNDKNCGTCKNLYNALKNANGEFVKPISPQDFLHNEKTLYNWYKYMKEENIQVSFGNAVYYEKDDDFMSIIQRESTQPIQKELYDIKNYKYKKILIDNFIFNDGILGAAYLCDKKILKKYLEKIIEKVKLCEDFSYRVMLLDDIKIYFYNSPVIYYCYGTGVSTKKKLKGKSFLRDDEIAFQNLICKMHFNDKFKMKIVKFLSYNFQNRYINRIVSFLYFPNAIKLLIENKFRKKSGKARTITDIDSVFLQSIGAKVYIEKS